MDEATKEALRLLGAAVEALADGVEAIGNKMTATWVSPNPWSSATRARDQVAQLRRLLAEDRGSGTRED